MDRQTDGTRSDVKFALFIIVAGLLIGIRYHYLLWQLSPDGLSPITKGTPYWDFSNLWAGSRMVLDGHLAYLFDVDAYRAELRRMFMPDMANQEWSYPPSILLIGAPLALLPIQAAFVLWTVLTAGLLFLAMRPLGVPTTYRLAVLLSPPVLVNAAFGQNGALTAALLIGGLALLPKRPVISGILIGILTIKPHLGILLPFALLASGSFRAFAAAAVTALAIAIITGLLFGFETWHLFAAKTMPLMSTIMEAPYPQPYHLNAVTNFIMVRSFGLGLGAAYAWQGIVTCAAIAATVWTWLPRTKLDHGTRTCLTALMALLATPYGYTYDTIPAAVAAMYFFAKGIAVPRLLLVALWMLPVLTLGLKAFLIAVTILIPLCAVVWVIVGRLVAGNRIARPSNAAV
ncbi:DUF2029 domain-containing protein [Agrobacterium sp. a22-2]|uniref:glycosyltransferase family 87 protein n=1 Tax=Agrobacterium sp. a22-2 TaxID=2283840 RepID=UPI0014483D9A|nr:glycosyltransferase family 87 protein [Agrobacterium sp. a22-2]NKN39185.1 DUF2029 domain-containing protein [Agrobacterium sp. a22-2]